MRTVLMIALVAAPFVASTAEAAIPLCLHQAHTTTEICVGERKIESGRGRPQPRSCEDPACCPDCAAPELPPLCHPHDVDPHYRVRLHGTRVPYVYVGLWSAWSCYGPSCATPDNTVCPSDSYYAPIVERDWP